MTSLNLNLPSPSLVTNVDFISFLVGSQFDLSNAFDLAPHSLILRKLSGLGLSVGYVNSKSKSHCD
jgi:hypothetical protein